MKKKIRSPVLYIKSLRIRWVSLKWYPATVLLRVAPLKKLLHHVIEARSSLPVEFQRQDFKEIEGHHNGED